jgi:hypothetical protein
MPAPLHVTLSQEEHANLQRARDHHAKPYVRERAAAILRVAAGQSARAVARAGCLKPRRVETVSSWVSAFRRGGVAGLQVAAGRGRKPAFSPSAPQSRGRPRRAGGSAASYPPPVGLATQSLVARRTGPGGRLVAPADQLGSLAPAAAAGADREARPA